MGTGIIFVVLVAIWAAYFVQYWSRRREHLATARSVEAFSEAMRVLERRAPLRASAADRISSAYTVSPARVVRSRPQVMAKPRSAGGIGMRPPTSSHRPTTPAARPRSPARSGPIPSRRVRGLALLAALTATLLAGAFAAFSTLPSWAPLVGVGAVLISFLWLRSAVQAEIRARRAARLRSRRKGAASTTGRPDSSSGASSSGASSFVARSDAMASDAMISDAAAGADHWADHGADRDAELIEDRTVTAQDAADHADGVDGWDPVPVPPPTYTLKAKAEPRGSASFGAGSIDDESGDELDIADLENPFAEQNPRGEQSLCGEQGAAGGADADQARAAYGT